MAHVRRPLPARVFISESQTPVVLPLSTIIQLRGGVPHMPYVAHKRLVPVIHTPVHTFYYSGTVIPVRVHSRVRPSVLAAELNRIRTLWRPSTESYVEKYLNSKDNIYFDDEAREIRARVDSLLRKVHVFIPRASPSDFAEEITPERMRSDDYVRRLLSGKSNMKKDSESPVSWYEIPERGNFGNLACVKYVAGKPQSVRRPYYKVADLRPSDIRNDVNLLSYYSKNRQAAANASPDVPKTERELRKARALETEWSEAIAKREAQKAQERAMKEDEEEAEKGKTQEEEKQEREIERKILEEATPKKTEVEPKKKPEEAPKEIAEEAPPKEETKAPSPPPPTPSVVEEPKLEAVKKTKAKKDTKKRATEPPQKEEPAPEPVQKEEPSAPVSKPEVPAPVPPEPEVSTPVPEPEAPAPVPEPEPVPEPMKKEEIQPEQEPITSEQPMEITNETQPDEQQQESKEETKMIETGPTEVPVSEETEQNEQDQSDSVRQQKQEAIKRAEEYLAKLAEEAKSEEQRRQEAEDERLRLEIEEQKAWEALQIAQERKARLDEIIEQEKAEEARKEEEKKMEAERIERMEEAERQVNTQRLAELLKEQEQMIIEENQKQEREEKLAEVALNGIGESKEYDCSCEDQLNDEITDQEREEKPYDFVMEDDTRIEEETAAEDEVEDIPADPFVEEPQGAEESRPLEGGNAAATEAEAKVEDVTSGGEEGFEWGDEDA